ncbi:MAG: hypothetical protein RI973_2285 [Bacteroidota bacterium]|jgi:putative hemolysin
MKEPNKDTLLAIEQQSPEEPRLLIECNRRDLKNLRVSNPVLFIANHAADEMDESVLARLFMEAGIPFKIITNGKRKKAGEEPWRLPVKFNLLHWKDYSRQVLKAIMTARSEGCSVGLILRFADRSLDAPVRNRLLNRIMRSVLRTAMPVVPIRLKVPFPAYFSPPLGTQLMRLNRGEPLVITVRTGTEIPPEELERIGKPKDLKRYIQSKIYSLGSALEVSSSLFGRLFRKKEEQEPIREPVDPALIAAEIRQLPFGQVIASQGEFDILVADARQIPNVLQEIGRLREITFRAVGEGSGKSQDLDEFDLYYQQLILWDREQACIAGGYRMGRGDLIFERYGPTGFYVSSLFKIESGFYPIMKQSIELGRSYVVPAYQKKRLPLFMLWRGILGFLIKNTQYRYLYGPVSISKHYSSMSRAVIVSYIRQYYFDKELAEFLKPRKPFKVKVDKVDIELLANSLGQELQALDNLIEDIEPDHIRLPVLLRQYLRLNARFISFNVDPQFSDVLDGFILLDLRDVPYEMIEALRKELNP